MARIIIRSLPIITGEKDTTYNESDIRSRMVDYDSIPVNLRDYVCKAYQLGILVGGADGYFRPNDSLTRASAAAVIHKMLEPGTRTVYTPPEEIWSDAELRRIYGRTRRISTVSQRLRTGKSIFETQISLRQRLSDKNNRILMSLHECAKTMAYYAKRTAIISASVICT